LAQPESFDGTGWHTGIGQIGADLHGKIRDQLAFFGAGDQNYIPGIWVVHDIDGVEDSRVRVFIRRGAGDSELLKSPRLVGDGEYRVWVGL